MSEKFEIENFRLPERLRNQFIEEVERLKTTKSQFVREALQEKMSKGIEQIQIIMSGPHEAEKVLTLSEFLTHQLKSIQIAIANNEEIINGILYQLFNSWRKVKRAEVRRKKIKGKRKKFKTKSTK